MFTLKEGKKGEGGGEIIFETIHINNSCKKLEQNLANRSLRLSCGKILYLRYGDHKIVARIFVNSVHVYFERMGRVIQLKTIQFKQPSQEAHTKFSE